MPRLPSRRDFARASAATLGLAPAVDAAPSLPKADDAGAHYQFPKDFLWGCATAAYQVEGAAREDGRAPSVWDTFTHVTGRIQMDGTGDVAADEYHRYKEDVQLLNWLGAKAYRFSVSWPRVFPQGAGAANEKGIAYYDRLVDELLAQGIEPWMTLFHWDLPQAIDDRCGGWTADTAKYFADYVAFVTKRLSDRVSSYFTINEFVCFTDLGYGSGVFAPGKRAPARELNQMRHHALVAHGLAVQAIRANARKPANVGLAENPVGCVPILETPEHIDAARKAMRELNAHFLTALLEGRYPDSYLRAAGVDAPRFTAEEMKTIASPTDFVGINAYSPTYIRADANAPAGYSVVAQPSSYPRMNVEWLYIGPQILYWLPRFVSELWGVKSIYITENGCPSEDRPAPDRQIYDTDRVMYLRTHLQQLHRAVAEGVPVRGYFVWSLIDNFEWLSGYTKRFGIVYVNFESQERIPKLSASFFRETIARNAVV
jgi:beta-glucosidase